MLMRSEVLVRRLRGVRTRRVGGLLERLGRTERVIWNQPMW